MSNATSPADNTTGAHDDIPAPGGAGNTAARTKSPWYLSKYVWTNLAALLALIIPDVRVWLDNNPVEFFSALGAVNILLQFITGGKYQLTGEGGQSGRPADPAGILPPAASGEDANHLEEDRSQDSSESPSSMSHGSGTSSPLSGSSGLMLVLGALMILLGGSCSSTDTSAPASTSVSLADGRVVVIRGTSSLVVDRTSHSLSWAQSTPDVVVIPPVVQSTSK